MLRTAIGFHWPEAMVGLTYEESEIDPSKLSSSMDQVYKTKDGKFVTCSCVSDKEWAAICDALGKPDWKDDKRFNTIAARMKNADERKQLTAELIAKAEYRDILERFLEEGVSGAPLLTRSELLQHEQLQANSDIEVHSFEGFGNVRQASPYARYDKTPSSIRMPAPQLGEHTEEILRKLS